MPNRKRVDVLGYDVSDGNPPMRLVECKASLRDLRGIEHQLEMYRRYAGMLYVAVPSDLESAARDLLPKGVGLLVVTLDANTVSADHGYLSTRCVKNPRRVGITGQARGLMRARTTTWLLAHFEKSRVYQNCGHEVRHGPN